MVSLVVQIIMARLLAPEDFGSLAIMLVFLNIGGVIVTSGLNTALVQAHDASEKDFSTVFWLSLCISILLYIIIYSAAPSIAEFYEMDNLVWPVRVLSILLIVNAYNSIQVAYVQRSLDFRKIFNASAGSIMLSGSIGIGCAVSGMGLWSLVIQQITYATVSCIIFTIQVPWRLRFAFDTIRARELLNYGWKLLVSGLLETCYQSIADLIIGKQFSASQLGYVSQGKKYPNAIATALDGSIQPVMLSAVAKVQKQPGQVKRLVRRALKTSCYIIMPCMVLLAVIAYPLVRLLLGEQWLPSVWFMQAFCITLALLPIHTTNLQALNAMGRSDIFLKLELIKKAYSICFVLYSAFVLNSVYWMVGLMVLASVISTFVNAYPNKRVINYSYIEQLCDLGPGVVLTIISAQLAAVVGFLGFPDPVQIAVQSIVMIGSYLGLSKMFHIEAFEYLIATLKKILERRR